MKMYNQFCRERRLPYDLLPWTPLFIPGFLRIQQLAKKQVRTNNDAAFQSNLLFDIFFMDDLLPLNCTIDFNLISHDFAIDFAIFTMW